MKFKTDENLHPGLAGLLCEHSHDAVTVWDEGLQGRSDHEIAEACRTESRVLITLDVGFGDIRAHAPETSPGLVVLRLGSQSRTATLAALRRILPLLDNQPLVGRLWIVDESRVRIRGGAE